MPVRGAADAGWCARGDECVMLGDVGAADRQPANSRTAAVAADKAAGGEGLGGVTAGILREG